MSLFRFGLLGAVGWVVGVTACGGQKPAAPNSEPGRSGVRVPLPAGWSFRPASDRLLLVGTQDHPVLRIEVLDEKTSLPTPAELAGGFVKHLKGIASKIETQQTKPDSSMVVVEVRRPSNNETTHASPELVLLGAKRVGASLFLCASEPGASASDVRVASNACEGLSTQ